MCLGEILQRTFSFAVGLLSLSIGYAMAQYSVDPLNPYTQLGGDPNDSKVHLKADLSEGDFLRSDFEGSVNASQGDTHLFAPKAHYDNEKREITTTDGVIIGTPNMAVEAKQGLFKIDQKVLEFQDANYYLKTENGQSGGHVQSAHIDRINNRDTLKQASWTTCNRLAPEWQLRAKNLTLDHTRERGIAKHATFRIGDVPVMYFPYLSFPINNQRATGFLMPSIGSSEERGVELIIPYYWNIAPNQDATFVFRPMTDRGMMIEGEYRLLTEHQMSTVQGSFLPHDNKADGKKRWRFRFDNDFKINDDWRGIVRYQKVSDIHYQDDFESGLNLYDDWYIERQAAAFGKGDWGNVMFRVQNFERISPNVSELSKPYGRLPQVLHIKNWEIGHLKLSMVNEAVRFQKTHMGSANRFTSDVSASYRLSKSYGYIEPKVSVNAAHYQFSPENHAFREEDYSRFLPTFSLEGKLIFERDFTIGGVGYTQTLEPTLFYLYTPYKDQSSVPLFDTSERTRSWSWLFARNRFIGGDRIGDANQLTTALTTRFYRNDDGQEKARLSLGQIQYFSDRKVQLYNRSPDEDSRSVLVTEGSYQIDHHWQLYGISFWDSNAHQNERSIADLRYFLDNDRYFSIGHSYEQSDYDQITVAAGWRVNPTWRLFGRYDYSLQENRGFNTMLGVEYNDCCWAWRLVGRNYRDAPDDEKSHSGIFLEFVFKGLGNMGSSTSRVLSDQLDHFQPLPQERSL